MRRERGDRSRLLAEYGHHLGMAFQLVDDVLGIWGDPGASPASRCRRTSRGTQALARRVVAALPAGTERAARRLRGVLARDGDLEVRRRCSSLAAESACEHGRRAVRWAQTAADLHTREALARSDRLAPRPNALADLAEADQVSTLTARGKGRAEEAG